MNDFNNFVEIESKEKPYYDYRAVFKLYNDEISKDNWLGDVPMVDVGTYSTPPCYIKNVTEHKILDKCPMRGSRRGMIIRHGVKHNHQYRKYEYSYLFARWLGARCAKRVKKTNANIIHFPNRLFPDVYLNYERVLNIILEEIKSGYFSVSGIMPNVFVGSRKNTKRHYFLLLKDDNNKLIDKKFADAIFDTYEMESIIK